MRKFREMLKDNAAFTLVELIVVIAVLGILAGIAVPRLTGVQDKAEKEALRANAKTIQNAMEMYYASEGEYPTEESDFDSMDDDMSIDLPTEVTIEDFSDSFTSSGLTVSGDDYEVTVTAGGISEPESSD
ncbi:MAG: type II secretion system protein [Candidatus Woesearchaeota archaeon]